MDENPIYKPSDKKNFKPVIIIIVIVLVALLLLFLVNQLSNKGTDNILGSQDQINLIDQYKNMLGELEQKVNSEPTNAQARRDYAVALYATGDLTKALEQYLEEQKYNAEDPVLYNNIGNIYRDQSKFENAVTSYKKAIELNKQLTNAYINLANLYIYSMDKLEDGIKVYKDAIKESPESIEIYLLLANTYEQAGEAKNAKEVFTQVLAKDPNNQAAKLGLERVK